MKIKDLFRGDIERPIVRVVILDKYLGDLEPHVQRDPVENVRQRGLSVVRHNQNANLHRRAPFIQRMVRRPN